MTTITLCPSPCPIARSGENNWCFQPDPSHPGTPQTSIFSHISNALFTNVKLGFGFGGLDAIATRQVDREDHFATKARAPSSKHAHKRKLTALVSTPSTPPLITPPSNGTWITSPPREDLQGRSPMDYELELKVKFPPEMVLEMQEGATRKARRIAIERTLGNRTIIKALHECLKLHLPTSFVSTTFLAWSYFEILCFNHISSMGLLWNPLHWWGGCKSNQENHDNRMERLKPLFLHIHSKLWCLHSRNNGPALSLDKSAIPEPPRTSQEHQSANNHGQQNRRGLGNKSNIFRHEKTRRAYDHKGSRH